MAAQLEQSIFASTIFVIVTLMVSIFILGILAANAIYFNKLIDNTLEDQVVSPGEARAMYYFNIFMMFPVIAVIIYSIFRLVAGNKGLAGLKRRALAEPTGVTARFH